MPCGNAGRLRSFAAPPGNGANGDAEDYEQKSDNNA
jgi:hypothetical protein